MPRASGSAGRPAAAATSASSDAGHSEPSCSTPAYQKVFRPVTRSMTRIPPAVAATPDAKKRVDSTSSNRSTPDARFSIQLAAARPTVTRARTPQEVTKSAWKPLTQPAVLSEDLKRASTPATNPTAKRSRVTNSQAAKDSASKVNRNVRSVGDDGVPAIFDSRSFDLYLTDRAILQKDTHHSLHIRKQALVSLFQPISPSPSQPHPTTGGRVSRRENRPPAGNVGADMVWWPPPVPSPSKPLMPPSTRPPATTPILPATPRPLPHLLRCRPRQARRQRRPPTGASPASFSSRAVSPPSSTTTSSLLLAIPSAPSLVSSHAGGAVPLSAHLLTPLPDQRPYPASPPPLPPPPHPLRPSPASSDADLRKYASGAVPRLLLPRPSPAAESRPPTTATSLSSSPSPSLSPLLQL